MVLVAVCEHEEYLEPITDYVRNKMFQEKAVYFVLSHRDHPFSLMSFQNKFSQKYRKLKPDEVYFILREELGGDDHLLYAKLYFERNITINTPFYTYIVKSTTECNSVVQEIPFELAYV